MLKILHWKICNRLAYFINERKMKEKEWNSDVLFYLNLINSK